MIGEGGPYRAEGVVRDGMTWPVASLQEPPAERAAPVDHARRVVAIPWADISGQPKTT